MGFVRPTAKYSSTTPVCIDIMCPGDFLTDSCVNSVDLCNSNFAKTIDDNGGADDSPEVQDKIDSECVVACSFDSSNFDKCRQKCVIDANILSGEIERKDPIINTQAQNAYDHLNKKQKYLLKKAYEENKSKLPHESYKPFHGYSSSKRLMWVLLFALIVAVFVLVLNKK